MSVAASWSCLGLGTCVGPGGRQIVDARVLLTAAAPPAFVRIDQVGYDEALPVRLTRDFLADPGRYLRYLFEDDPPAAR